MQLKAAQTAGFMNFTAGAQRRPGQDAAAASFLAVLQARGTTPDSALALAGAVQPAAMPSAGADGLAFRVEGKADGEDGHAAGPGHELQPQEGGDPSAALLAACAETAAEILRSGQAPAEEGAVNGLAGALGQAVAAVPLQVEGDGTEEPSAGAPAAEAAGRTVNIPAKPIPFPTAGEVSWAAAVPEAAAAGEAPSARVAVADPLAGSSPATPSRPEATASGGPSAQAVPSRPQVPDGAADPALLPETPGVTGPSASNAPAHSERATQAAPAPRAAPAEQVAEGVLKAASAPGGRFTFVLSPADLGRVEVTLTKGDGHHGATVLVDRPETLEAIRSELRSLERILAEAGMDVRSGSVSVAIREGRTEDGRADGEGHSSSSRPANETPVEPVASRPASSKRSLGEGRGMNLNIKV